MTALPREAREGLLRAWIALLQEKHPGVAWIALENNIEATTMEGAFEDDATRILVVAHR